MAIGSRNFEPGTSFSITSGATASGPANPAAQASARLSLNAISMAVARFEEGRRLQVGARCRSIGLRRGNFRRRFHLGHQVIVPLSVDLEVGGTAELDGLDQIVRDIGVDAGLEESVERRT